MSELPKNASSHDGKPTGLVFRDGNRRAKWATQADRMLARYPADVREQYRASAGSCREAGRCRRTDFGGLAARVICRRDES